MSQEAPAVSTLLAIRGPLAGARLVLDQDNVVLGRSPGSTITLADGTVSRTHAILRRARLGWMLEDCDSAAGTYLNAHRVKTPVPVSSNDEIRIGHSIFLFNSEFDLQNADFTDNSVFFSTPHDETIQVEPVATLETARTDANAPARHGMEFLTELGELFDSSRIPFGDALKSSVERMGRILRAEIAMLLLYDNGAKSLRVSAAVAPGDILADKTLLNRVFAERRAILISDKPELVDHPAPNAPTAPAKRSVVAAPLVVDDTCLGVIFFERHELDAYSLKDLRLAQSLGRLMAVFVEARQKAEATALRVNLQQSDTLIIGGSQRFRKMLDMVRRVANSPVTVLLVGETGSGKEVIAQEIHRLGQTGREAKPFVAVNCAAIPEALFEAELFGHERGSFTGAHRMRQGLIEAAQGGTLFLDEIGEMVASLQPKLLRFLQEGTYMRVGGNRLHRADVRVIAATNRDLVEEVKANRFREDLFHRLSVVPLEVPPLRERREDIRPLADFFTQKYAKQLRREILGISEEALIQLEKYPWPGNVRELANSIERAVLLSDDRILLPRHFSLGQFGLTSQAPAQLPSRAQIPIAQFDNPGPGETLILRKLEDVEREYILKVMKASGDNQVKAAELLGIHRNTLRKKLQEYGVLS